MKTIKDIIRLDKELKLLNKVTNRLYSKYFSKGNRYDSRELDKLDHQAIEITYRYFRRFK